LNVNTPWTTACTWRCTQCVCTKKQQDRDRRAHRQRERERQIERTGAGVHAHFRCTFSEGANPFPQIRALLQTLFAHVAYACVPQNYNFSTRFGQNFLILPRGSGRKPPRLPHTPLTLSDVTVDTAVGLHHSPAERCQVSQVNAD